MDFTKIVAVIFACIGVSYAVTTATIANPTPKAGENVVLKCRTSPAGSRYATFSHTKKFKESDTPIVLGERFELRKNALSLFNDNRYNVTAKYIKTDPDAEEYDLAIQRVKFSDSGFLGCRYTDDSKVQDEFASVVVQVDSESLEFAEYQDQTDLDYEDFKGDKAKNLKLTCVAKGTLPGTHKLFLGTEDITPKATVVDTGLQQDGITGKTKASWTSTLIFDKPFTDDLLSKSITCQSKTGDFPMRKIQVHLQSKVAKPHLMCTKVEIDEVKYGQSANFSCTVNIKPALTNVTYTWPDEDKGTIYLFKGENYKNEIFSFYEPNANKTMAKLTLNFKQIKYYHKNMKLNLYVSNTGGHATQDFLIRNVGEVSGSAHIVPSIFTIIMAAVTLLWRGL